jgi:hypothetical protein
MNNGKRYNITLASKMDRDLEDIAEDLGTTKAEVFRRALVLFKHAVKADEVKLVKGAEETKVIFQ